MASQNGVKKLLNLAWNNPGRDTAKTIQVEAGTEGVEMLLYQKQFMEVTIRNDYMTMRLQCVSPAA